MLPLKRSKGSEDSAASRRRLSDLRSGAPYTSQSALSAVLEHVRDHGLPSNSLSRRTLNRARDAIATQSTPYGNLVKTIELQCIAPLVPITFDVACPFSMLHLAAKTKQFGALLQDALKRDTPSPTRPWGLIYYCDEITPGNGLKAENLRQTQSVYYSFLNLGSAVLAKEDAWMTFATLKSSDVTKVRGGMSAVTSEMLKMLFTGTTFTLDGVGVLVQCGEVSHRLYASFQCTLCDESSLHQVWQHKGASGVKFCVECRNMVASSWIGLPGLAPGSFLKPFTDPQAYDETGLVRHTRETIFAIIDELAAASASGISNNALVTIERRLGFTHCPQGILAQPSLRRIIDPTQQNCYDWPHSLLQGAFPLLVGKIERDLKALGFNMYQALHIYCKNFTWPRRLELKGARGGEAFSAKRARGSHKHGLFKATQSEVLSVYMIIAYWMRAVLQPLDVLSTAVSAYLALADFTSMLVATAKGLVHTW